MHRMLLFSLRITFLKEKKNVYLLQKEVSTNFCSICVYLRKRHFPFLKKKHSYIVKHIDPKDFYGNYKKLNKL
jgi:hypothetical protein